jgi:hypothetical protein
VLFNCQTLSIAQCLRALLPDHAIKHYRFADVAASPATIAEAADTLLGCDVVVTTTTGTRLGAADPAALARSGVRVLKIPHLVFGGYHPDSCYSPDPARGIVGPTERFHSRIAACAFLAGLDIDDTIALYSRLPFARLGYFDRFAEQRAAMIGHWAGYGIDLAPWFARWAASGCFMHSTNHPKIIALYGVAQILCDMLGVQSCDAGGQLPPDPMLTYASHPVYAVLAEFLGVAPEAHFRPPATRGKPAVLLDLQTYLARSFAAFAAAPRAALRDLDGVPGAMQALGLGEKLPAPGHSPSW